MFVYAFVVMIQKCKLSFQPVARQAFDTNSSIAGYTIAKNICGGRNYVKVEAWVSSSTNYNYLFSLRLLSKKIDNRLSMFWCQSRF
jgi:hypothetical protein